MTRKSRRSKRELERAFEDLAEGGDASTSDAAQGVTAEWVTYDWGTDDDVDDPTAEFVTPGEDGDPA